MPLRPTHAATVAWWIWVIGQAGVVGLYAAGVPLAGGYPAPVEGTADLGLAVGQLVLASCIGPPLVVTPARAVAAVAAAAPMTVLAARLSGVDAATACRTALVTLAWALALALPGGRVVRALSAGVTLGGPLLWYVALEYGQRSVPLGGWPTLFCPPLGVCSTRLHGVLAGPLAASAIACLGLFALGGLEKSHSRRQSVSP